ncbi:MAG TPA: efflux transporter outer membrane subunit [Vicinamibacterales bacterium]
MRSRSDGLRRAAVAAFVAGLCAAGCAVGPKYVKPAEPTSPAYKETPPGEAGKDWTQAAPADAVQRGEWWRIFGDATLDHLETSLTAANQNLKIADAQYRQARAAVRSARAAYVPQIGVAGSITPGTQSANRPLRNPQAARSSTDFLALGDVSYEPDFWGRIGRTVEASRAEAQATAADLELARLSLHAECAIDYFALRGLDAQKALLDSTVAAYQRALELAQNRYAGGLASGADVAQAQTQLESTRAQAIDLDAARAQLQHAIAVLIGQPPATFSLAAQPLTTPPPAIPPGVPSQLLERRPDIAAAERQIAAANANLGLASTAFYPLLTLTASGGFESGSIGDWFKGLSAFWMAGPAAALTVFDGGRRRARVEQARAAYDQTVAGYRETVLQAFQEVEDNLATLRVLQQEAQTQAAAVNAAQRSLTLATNRYRGGVTSYLEVTVAQTVALTNERTAVGILTRQMTASVLLVKALGGGWNTAQLPAGHN